MVTQHIVLDMTPGTKPIVNVSQYDTGARTLVFHLRQNRQTFTPPDGCTGILHGIKPDSTYFSYAAEIEGDTVVADCTEQMTACVGFAECEVRLSNSEGHVGSANFLLNCEKSPMEGAVISESVIAAAEQLTDRAEQAASSATASATAASASAEAAEESASAASTSETNAAASATAASTSAEEAGESATAAAESASSASGSEASARQYSAAAEGFANDAENSAQGAAQDAQTASDKASEAAASADRASDSAVDSATAANLASGYADTARAQAQAAEGSATNAAGSASDASDSAAAALASEQAAAQSAADIAASAAQIQINTENIAALQIVESTSAADITSIEDGADGVPMKSLKVYIEPQQDLHGYDNPWPAGGGKNKLKNNLTSGETNGLTITVDADGVISFSGTTNATTILNVNADIDTEFQRNTNYVLSGCTGGNFSTYRLEIYKRVGDNAVNYNGNTQFQLLDTDSSCICRIVIQSGTNMSGIKFYPMIRLATESDATFAPYSNICPISGWDSVETVRTGVNQWDEEWEVGYINLTTGEPVDATDRIRSKNYNPCRPGMTVYAIDPTRNYNVRFFWYKADKTFLSVGVWVGNSVVTVPDEAYYFKFIMGTAYGTTYNHDISINYPSTDTDYHPYTGQTITTSLPSTVYGGVLDVVTGELTVDRAMVDLGTLNWNKSGDSPQDGFIGVASPRGALAKAYGRDNIISTAYAPNTQKVGIPLMTNGMISGQTTNNNVYVRDDRASTAADIKTLVSGVYAVYKIATPTTYTLTPEEVKTLLKQNNVFANAGQTAIVYVADPKTYIDNSIADAVASLT